MRIEKIDLLRFVGISGVILAHVSPPEIVFQARNFDVPLMVLVSGVVFQHSGRKEVCYREYLVSRIPRLCLPVWLFLTFLFFVAYPFFYLLLGVEYPFSLKTIVTSYLLLSGIGYVWIIKVFVLVTLIAPPIRSVSEKIRSNTIYLLLVLLIFLMYSLLLPWFTSSPIIRETLSYLIPYACVFALGVRLSRISRDKVLLLSFLFLTIFLGIFLYFSGGETNSLQAHKYPPQTYYLSYAMFLSLIFYSSSDFLVRLSNKVRIKPSVIFIGQNSMWIYLWHIFILEIRNTFELKLSSFSAYIFVYSLAIILAYSQVYLIDKITRFYGIAGQRKKFILSILTG